MEKSPLILFPKTIMNVKGGSSKYYMDAIRVVTNFCRIHSKACQHLVVIFDRLPSDYSSLMEDSAKRTNGRKVLYVLGSEPLEPYVRDFLKSHMWAKSFLIPPFYLVSHLRHGSQLTMNPSLQIADYLIVPSKVALRYLKIPTRTEVRVLHPSVDTCNRVNPMKNRRDIIVMLGRISPEKNYEIAVRILHGLRIPDARLLIMGFLSRTNYDYYLYLRHLAKRLHVHERLTVLTNVNEAVKKKMLSLAKVVLHSRMDGLFEISVAEGMGFGCVPIVRYGSTSWWEILRCGKYGLSYKTVNEATDLIKGLLLGDTSLQEYSTLAHERARQLSFSVFKEKLYGILEEIITT